MKYDKLNFFTSIKFLSKYVLKHKKNFAMFYIGWFIDTILSIIMPILFGIMVDEVVYYQNMDTFLKISLVFVIMSIFSCILYFLIYAHYRYLMSMYTFDIEKDLFDHLSKCDAQYLTNADSGDIILMVQEYPEECMHFIVRNIIHQINAIIGVILIGTFVFIINWQIGLILLVVVPVSVLVSGIFGKKIRGYADKQREYYGEYISWVYEIFSGIRDIRMLGAAKRIGRVFVQKNRKMYDLKIKAGISTITSQNIINFTNLSIQLIIFTFAGYSVINHKMTIGLLTIILSYFTILTSKVAQISTSYLDAQNRISYIQRLYDFLGSPTEEEWQGRDELVVSHGDIQFSNIEFAYNGSDNVIKDFSLDIRSGERFALVGKSGCGKTTVAYMMIGFYRPQHGSITIDGQNLADCSLSSIRANIGLVAQDVMIFNGSIRDNLLLGNRRATDAEIISACRNAGIYDFIDQLDKRLDTIIGPEGIALSSGQKQRIAIARIYLKDPKIIIFDEATSELDFETEEQIHDAWENALNGRTSIIIAHRQSSVMLCDRVGIMEDGKLADIGIPTEMAAGNIRFKTLFVIKGGGEYVEKN